MSTIGLNHRILQLTPPQSATIITPQFRLPSPPRLTSLHTKRILYIAQSLSSSSSSSSSSPSSLRIRFNPSTRLYVSGLSFRTTDESLRNAFEKFGQLEEVNLVMDKIANRPRGFAFIRYAKEEESKNAIEGMHGKFLDGRVIFVEVAKSRSESKGQLHRGIRPNP